MLFCGVIALLVAFRLCEDAEECRIAVRYPMAEGKTANKDGDAREDGIEEIEGSHRAHADEVEECALHAQVSEWLVQALINSICATLLMCFFWHRVPLC